MIDDLAVGVANKLKVSYSRSMSAKFDYVFFAGRGFQMKKLREAVLENLKKINSDICSNVKVVPLVGAQSTSATYKNICLFVREQLASGRYNGRLVGRPQIICHNEDPGIAEDLLDNDLTSENEVNASKEKSSLLTKLHGQIKEMGKLIQKLVPESEPTETYNYLGGNDVDELNRELVNGFKFEFRTSADEIVFSGVSYPIPPNINPQSPAQIFFTGSEFVFRQDGTIGYLSAPTNLDCQHVFESSFPFAQLSGAANALVPFPKGKHINSKLHETEEVNAKDELSGYGREDEDILNKYLKS